ncbi:MAG: bifunctional DNA-binding transcriptional regulator/O6-methylguanine-DNA methyltransferase Ada [Sphingomonadales bacterium]|nr:bifunctional DNA-binding transcriptional regulator/O6-methylguanine-DNA methyltransferase Ada [Sphingomonadales bacterium]
MIHGDEAWAAVLRRDRSFDGRFVTGVHSTGIYCRPSCAARHPARCNVAFYKDGNAARAVGLRPCKRCLPDDVTRDQAAIIKALELLASDDPPRLAALAGAVGYAPHHFSRIFKRDIGLSPAAWLRSERLRRAEMELKRGVSVTEAIYAAGYNAPSRFYADSKRKMGMTPSAWKNGGAGVVIRYAIVDTTLGPMLVAATDKGICRLSFGEDKGELIRRFPKAVIEPGGAAIDNMVKGAVAVIENPRTMPDLPLDVAGTAFQEAVWQALRRIPPGETRSYAEIAAAVGKPGAVRAAGSANGANNVAILIPCHRVIRSDGSLGGYAYGLAIKQELLRREAQHGAGGSAGGK